jgi:succinyl-CoA synthetase beta subunit
MKNKEIEYAVKEAQSMGFQVNSEQAVKFVVRNAGTDEKTAKQALTESVIKTGE